MAWHHKIQDSRFLIGHDPYKWDSFVPRITRQAIERECQKVAESGANSIQSSFAHYRWNFVSHVDQISQFIGDLCEIGHKYGLGVWEHHSVVLAFPQLIKDVRYKKWQLDKLTKIDLRSGAMYESPKGTVVFCCSNPDFKEAYFDLAKRFVIEHPIDLYMPDDMAWGDDYYECGCEHCRLLFKQMTGFDLPKTGDLDEKFYANMSNPAWRAWLRFRSTRVAVFLKELKDFMAANGKGSVPMTTCNSDSLQTFTGRIQGTDHEEYNSIGRLDLGIYEIWHNESLTYNWIRNFVEQSTNQAIGNQYGIPYYVFAYPAFNDEAVFNSGRNLTVGMGSWFDGYLKNGNYSVNKFVKRHSDLFFGPKTVSNVGVVFSRNTRDFYREDVKSRSGLELFCDEYGGWCEGLIRMNLPFRIITESFAEGSDLSDFDVLILPNCACMSAALASKLEKFVHSGGRLICTHETSLYSDNGTLLSNFQLSGVLGINYCRNQSSLHYPIIVNYSTTAGACYGDSCTFVGSQYNPEIRDQIFSGIKQRFIPHNAEMALIKPVSETVQVLAHWPVIDGLRTGYASVVYNQYGKGEVIYIAGLPGIMNNTRGIHWGEIFGEGLHADMTQRIPAYQNLIENTINST